VGPRRFPAALLGAAVLIQLLIITRAHVQAITMDEANTYLQWAATEWPAALVVGFE